MRQAGLHKIYFILILFALGFLSPIGKADDTSSSLTLQSALQEAIDRSPAIQRVRAEREEKGWKRFETFGNSFLPKISVNATRFLDVKYSQTLVDFGGAPVSFPGFFPNTMATLDVTLPIFNGFANLHQFQGASLLEEASEKELNHAEFELAENVELAFYDALAASLLQEVAHQNVKTLEDHFNQINIRKKGGVATKVDTLRVEVQLNEARADVIDAEDNANLTRKKLAQLLGMEKDDRPLEGQLPIPDTGKVAKLELTDVKNRPDIEALELKVEAAEKYHAASTRWLVPSIFLAGQYSWYDSQIITNTVTNTGNYANAYNVGVQLRWNLFDGGVSWAQERQASYRAKQTESAAQLARLQIPYDFAYWKRRYLSNTDHYLSKKLDIERSEESVRLAKEEERAGTRTSSETLDAELDLFRARAGVVNAQLKASEAKIKLELALGRRIL